MSSPLITTRFVYSPPPTREIQPSYSRTAELYLVPRIGEKVAPGFEGAEMEVYTVASVIWFIEGIDTCVVYLEKDE
jgi:hypothetical protein